MRTIAIVNQKGGVGKTTTTVNLGAALALGGQRVLLIDLDPQANLSMHLALEAGPGEASIYDVLLGSEPLADVIRPTSTPGLSIVASNIDLSGAELELASALGRETLLRDALETWQASGGGEEPVDFVLFDCPPSLGLLSINGLAAAREVFIALQTEFFALQGTGKLVEVVQLLQRRINPELLITGIVPCLYDSRLRLAREVLAEIRKYFPGQVFGRGIGTNVKLAEAPSYGQTIFEYAPESKGAKDYEHLARLVLGDAGTAPAPGATPHAAEPPVELRPASPVASAGPVAPAIRGEAAPRIVRAEDLPELPTEAFRAPATD